MCHFVFNDMTLGAIEAIEEAELGIYNKVFYSEI